MPDTYIPVLSAVQKVKYQVKNVIEMAITLSSKTRRIHRDIAAAKTSPTMGPHIAC